MKKIFYIVGLLAASITTNVNAQDTTKTKVKKDEFKPSGKLSGQIFGDFQYKAETPDSANLQQGSTQYSMKNGYYNSYGSFELRRIYLGYDYNFSEKLSTQLLISHEGANMDAQGNRSIMVKAANIRWKGIFKGTDVLFGQMSTPTYSLLSEQVWGYRSIEKTIMDMRGISKSNDLGIALQGKYLDGNLGYNVMAGNNTSTTPENDNFKKFYGDVWAKFLDKKIIVDANADYEVNQLSNGNGQAHSLKSKTTVKGFVAYQTSTFTVGVEAFAGIWKNYSFVKDTIKENPDVTKTDTVNAMPFGASVFAKYAIIKEKLTVFARFDMYNPDTKYNPALKYNTGSVNGHISETFIVAGVDFTPVANVHIMPNIWINSYKENADITNNNLYKKGKGVQEKGVDMDYRLTMFWKF